MKSWKLLTCGAVLAMSINALYAAQSDSDQFSYIVGYNLGTNFKSQDITVNPKQMLKGLNDGLSGEQSSISAAQQAAIMAKYQKMISEKIQAQSASQADSNAKTGADFLAKNAKADGVVTTTSGLQYKVIKAGKGDSPKATDTVTVNYEGKLINGTVFDSSFQRGQPATFALNQVISGWTEGLQLMKPGAEYMFYIPANLAYGDRAMGSVIPPNSTLIFKVDLISVAKN